MDEQATLKTKAEVCEALDISPKTLERLMAKREITPERYERPARGGLAMPMFTADAIEALRKRLEQPKVVKPRPRPASQAMTVASPVALDLRRPSLPPSELERKMAWTVAEASVMTGVGPERIEKGIRAGELVAVPVGPKGARVLLADAVRDWTRSLFERADDGQA